MSWRNRDGEHGRFDKSKQNPDRDVERVSTTLAIGDVTTTNYAAAAAAMYESERALLNLILRERWRASRLPSVPSALRDLDPHQPLSRKLFIGAPDSFVIFELCTINAVE
jgi:hypothetical protein